MLLTGLTSGTQAHLATIPGLPAASAEQIVNVVRSSDGQALIAMRGDPQYAAVVPAIEAAFTDAARTAGLVAGGFVALGFLFSLLLPRSAREVAEADAATRRLDLGIEPAD